MDLLGELLTQISYGFDQNFLEKLGQTCERRFQEISG